MAANPCGENSSDDAQSFNSRSGSTHDYVRLFSRSRFPARRRYAGWAALPRGGAGILSPDRAASQPAQIGPRLAVMLLCIGQPRVSSGPGAETMSLVQYPPLPLDGHAGDVPTHSQNKSGLRACQLRDPPGRAPGGDLVPSRRPPRKCPGKCGAGRSAAGRRDFARRDQVVLKVCVADIEAVRRRGSPGAV